MEICQAGIAAAGVEFALSSRPMRPEVLGVAFMQGLVRIGQRRSKNQEVLGLMGALLSSDASDSRGTVAGVFM